jgi:hypothetical protein
MIVIAWVSRTSPFDLFLSEDVKSYNSEGDTGNTELSNFWKWADGAPCALNSKNGL